MENRHGLAVDVRLTPATGTAEREAAVAMSGSPGSREITWEPVPDPFITNLF